MGVEVDDLKIIYVSSSCPEAEDKGVCE